MSFHAIERLLPVGLRPAFRGCAKRINNGLLGGNRLRCTGAGNRLAINGAILTRTSITIVGDGNVVEIGEESRLKDAAIVIRGDGHHLRIGAHCSFTGILELIGRGNRIVLGDRTSAIWALIAAFEQATTVTLGRDCMLSSAVDMRTGDSHGIIDGAGRRLNPAEDITIADHVWIGRGATILKGTTIGANCVVGACAVVTKDLPAHTLAAGIPARVLRDDVDWVRDLGDLPAVPAAST